MDKTRSQVRSVGISQDEARRKRETQTLTLRKKARDEMFAKRRNSSFEGGNVAEDETQLLESVCYLSCFPLLFNISS